MSSCCRPLAKPGEPRLSFAEDAKVSSWWRIGVAALIASQSMVLALAINLSEAAPDERLLLGTLLLFGSLLVLGLLGVGLATECWRALSARRVSVELLFSLGILGALGTSTLALWRGHGGLYYEVVSILLVIYESGRLISGVARRRALRRSSLSEVDRASYAVETSAGVIWKVGSALVAGDVILTPPGARLPVDGVLLDRAAFVTDTELSGEPAASVRRAGDMLWAGTRAVDALRVSARRVAGQRELDRLERELERAMAQPSSIERQADRLARHFVPVVIALAVSTFAVWASLAAWDRALFNGMAVLLVACPCALGFATPLAIWVTLGRWAGRGFVAQSGEVVEKLATIDTVVFDKTGTLTDPDRQNVRWHTFDVDRAWLAALVGAVQARTEHPIASALCEALLDGVPATRFEVAATWLVPGRGVAAQVRGVRGGTRVVIGTPEIVTDARDRARLDATALELGASPASWIVAVMLDERLAGVAVLDERVSAGVPAALLQLERLGLGVVLLSGDAPERAQRLGISQTLSRQTAEDKREYVERLTRAGRRVLFVGDGSNDVAAMAASAVSLAMGRGALLPRQIADLVSHGSSMENLPWAISLARSALGVVRSHLILAAAYNGIGIGLAAAGLLHPVVAALLMLASSLSVIGRTVVVLGPQRNERPELNAPARSYLSA